MTGIQFQHKWFAHPLDCLVFVGISLHPAPPPLSLHISWRKGKQKDDFYPRSIKVGLPYTPQSLTTTQKLSHVNKDFSIKKTSLKMHYVKTLNQDLHLLFLTVWTKQRKKKQIIRDIRGKMGKRNMFCLIFSGSDMNIHWPSKMNRVKHYIGI